MAARKNPRNAFRSTPIRTAVATLRRLFEIADEREISASDLSSLIGVDRQRISEWRSGKVTPSAMVLEELAAALGVTINVTVTVA